MLQATDKGSLDRIRAHNLPDNNQKSDHWAAKRLIVSTYNEKAQHVWCVHCVHAVKSILNDIIKFRLLPVSLYEASKNDRHLSRENFSKFCLLNANHRNSCYPVKRLKQYLRVLKLLS